MSSWCLQTLLHWIRSNSHRWAGLLELCLSETFFKCQAQPRVSLGLKRWRLPVSRNWHARAKWSKVFQRLSCAMFVWRIVSNLEHWILWNTSWPKCLLKQAALFRQTDRLHWPVMAIKGALYEILETWAQYGSLFFFFFYNYKTCHSSLNINQHMGIACSVNFLRSEPHCLIPVLNVCSSTKWKASFQRIFVLDLKRAARPFKECRKHLICKLNTIFNIFEIFFFKEVWEPLRSQASCSDLTW